MIKYGTLAKMNPPLREEADRQAVIRGLVDGTIDMIATDHAPHTAEEKQSRSQRHPAALPGWRRLWRWALRNWWTEDI